MMDHKGKKESFLSAIEENIKTLLEERCSFSPRLFAACSYFFSTGGKRIRPLFFLSILDGYKKEITQGLNVASSLEFLHSYSLIHDDLPSIDNDDFRREMPTLHKAFDEATAILSGDYLLTLAFDVLAFDNFVGKDQKLSSIQAFCNASGSLGLIGGQMDDIYGLKESDLNKFELLESLHLKKTAKLFILSFELGAIFCSASQQETALLKNIGEHTGRGYQGLDDLEDYLIDSKDSTKISAPSILGETKALSTTHYHFKKALEDSNKLPGRFSFLKELLFELEEKSKSFTKTLIS